VCGEREGEKERERREGKEEKKKRRRRKIKEEEEGRGGGGGGEREHACASGIFSSFPFSSIWAPAYVMVLPIFRAHLPPLVNPL
jgi:hypothetical protein